MSKYLMTLTPQEPYFFGNEKSFKYPETDIGNESNRYYSKSERVPAQTSIIGTLRYILLPIKKTFGSYTDDDIKTNGDAVGYDGFKYGANRTFGKIKSVSPLFILKDGKEILVTTPFDHQKDKNKYTPFSYQTIENGRVYPIEYTAKDGIACSFMSVDNGDIFEIDSLFKTEMRVGINRAEEDFFKKEYVILKDGFCFAVYVTIDDDFDEKVPQNTTVFMGQGKSLFTVAFTKVDDDVAEKLEEQIADKLSDNTYYCMSDVFVESNVYEKTVFAITDTRDYRAYKNDKGHITKDSTLYRLVCAGSVFVCHDANFAKRFKDSSVEIIGYNKVITKTEEMNDENSIL